MTPSRSVVSASMLAAVGLLGVTACGGEKPSGIAPLTPAASVPAASPSPTITSKWTPEQQQVVVGHDRFNDLMTAFRTKAEKLDVPKSRKVAKEPFVTEYLKGVDSTIGAGFVQTGKVVSTVASVTVTGDAATIRTCVDDTRIKFVNPGNPSGPAVQVPPPSWQTVTLVRERGSWLVAGLKSGGGTCVSG